MGAYLAKSLVQTLHTFWQIVSQFLPRVLGMVIIILGGWLVAWLVKVSLRRILGWLKFNAWFSQTGFTQALTRAALPAPAELVARLAFWVLWITFTLVGLDALQIPVLQHEISGLFEVLPQVIVALIILSAGMLV